MMVYGDHIEVIEAKTALRRLQERRGAIGAAAPGLARHAALVNLHIEAGRMLQGLLDRRFDAAAGDTFDRLNETWTNWMVRSARDLVRSWALGGTGLTPSPLPDCPSGRVRLKTPEGYAYYGLFPEAFIGPARRLGVAGRGVRVIGLRSIGVSLAPVVAAAIDAPLPLSLRPFGPPFERRVKIEDATFGRVLAGAERYIVVDEGPGLSGSSFAAVARFLMNRGVSAEQIIFMPSHDGGPGPAASPSVRSLWRAIAAIPADPLPDDETVTRWIGDLLDQPVLETMNLSAGRWRPLRLAPGRWPGVDPRTDRRKLLVRTPSGAFVGRFSGLRSSGEVKLERALRLAGASAVPSVVGVAHGFIVQDWVETTSITRVEPEQVGAYFRKRFDLPWAASADTGPADLAEMALANTEPLLGPLALRRMEGFLRADVSGWRPYAMDGACQPWKWLRKDGVWLKADALDHDADHDLLGPLDLAWDLAGAAWEMKYSAGEFDRLLKAARPSGGRAPRREVLRLCLLSYPAFRLGAGRLAQSRFASGSEEWLRHERALGRLGRNLVRFLSLLSA